MFKINIEITDPELIKLLKTEFENLLAKRFTIKTSEKEVAITANDAVALKTALNSVIKAAEIYEKIGNLENDQY